MPSPVDLALTSLLPTVSFLPPELIDLATSLLAQSRFKAASLKPEEEIARTYACCHIACQRLQNPLSLEISRPVPPCKPRVYQKLLEYFQSALSANPTTPRNTRFADREAATTPRSSHKKTTDDSTPSKQGAWPPTTPTLSRSSRKRKFNEVGRNNHMLLLNEQTMPLIREVCKALGEPRAAPHAFVGVETIYLMSEFAEAFQNGSHEKGQFAATPRSARQKSSDKESILDSKLQRLIVNVCFLTVVRMTAVDGDAHLIEHYRIADDAAISYLSKTLRSSNMKTSHTRAKEYQAELHALQDNGWSSMEWYRNVPTPSEGKILEAQAEAREDTSTYEPAWPQRTPLRRSTKRAKSDIGGEEDAGPAGLLPGLGTMFQPALDWLTRDRRTSYSAWEAAMLKRIALLERTP